MALTQAIRSTIIVIDDDNDSSNIILKENETNKRKKQTILSRYYSPNDELSNPISNFSAADERIGKRQEVLKFNTPNGRVYQENFRESG